MTLEEYKSDQQSLLARLSQGDSDRFRFVETYLKIKTYSDYELRLLIMMTEDQITEKLIEEHLHPSLPPDENDFYPEEPTNPGPPTNYPWKNEEDLVRVLSNAMETPSYPFEKVKLRYLTSPDKLDAFVDAESFMIQFEYFSRDGAWDSNLELKELITFLNLLITAGILKYSTEKDMNDYFSKRYKMDSIGGLLRPNKLKQHTKFDSYIVLIARLGLNVDDFLKRNPGS